MTHCPHCHLAYRDLHTGETFATVRRMMYTSNPDRSQWRHKHRRGVLGFWHELKLLLWRSHVDSCREWVRFTADHTPTQPIGAYAQAD